MAITLGQQPLTIPTEDLVLHLDANNTSSYPGSGTVWNDLSGRGNNFNINASAFTTSSGIKYMNFGGSYGCAKAASGYDMFTTSFPHGEATLITWTRVLNSTAAHRTLTRALSSGGDHHIIIGGTAGTTYQLGMYDNTNGGAFVDSGYLQTSIPGYNTGTWNMLVWRFRNYSPYYVFTLNNSPGTVAGSSTNINSKWKKGICSIGAYNNGDQSNVNTASQYWGDISNFLYYERSLTDAEITQIYNATAPTYTGAAVQYETLITYSDSTGQTTAYQPASIGGSLLAINTYSTAGSFTWSRPSGCTKVLVKVVGAGGGAAGYCESGGAGGYSEVTVDVTGVSTVAVTVGAGGTCVTYYAAGGAGGTSSFGSYASATGGLGSNSSFAHTGGHGGVGSLGTVNLNGGGGTGHANSAGNGAIGNGGASFWGGSSTINRGAVNTKIGTGAPGSGGPGSRTDDGNGGTTGRLGEDGMVVVYSYT
jgi:hypothetical protein